jgi:arylsulfatase A-like enzyme/Tfp pilus assembly protein PilF
MIRCGSFWTGVLAGLAWMRLESVSGRRTALRGRSWPLAGQLRELAWSPQSSRAVVIIGRRPPNGVDPHPRQTNRANMSAKSPDCGHGWPRPGAHRRAGPSAVSLFVGLSTGGLAEDRTHDRNPASLLAIMASAAIALCLTAACGGGVRQNPFVPDSLRGWNVLLVTIDTLRFDRVGAYGNTLGLTPTLDRLAAEGQRAATAYAHVPLTLPSHATLMTGMYPFSNGVRDNGSFRLDGSEPTLAKALKAGGYRTGAFVGAFVLDARFGLNAGFDVYDDRMTATGGAPEVVQRPAEQVLAPAADWILGEAPAAQSASAQSAIRNPQSAMPWFVWTHLYDPHEPYAPPEPYRSRYAADLYAGEVAYTDASLGVFLDRLRAAGALSRTLIVVAADHGESLGEHGERTHGLFAYDATLRVPLVFWAPPALPAGTLDGLSRLIDVTPTILDLTGIAQPQGIEGRTLRSSTDAADGNRRSSYFEALNANLTRNWAPLKGVIVDRLKLVDLPIPELYDLTSDLGETRNIYASQLERARPLEQILDGLSRGRGQASPAIVDADAQARLRSLGYVVGSTAKPAVAYTAADDPKRLVHLNQALDDAADQRTRGNTAAAIETLHEVIRERPDMTLAYDRLALLLQETGRVGEAVTVLDNAARGGHADAALLRSLGSLLRSAGDLPRSASVLEALVKQDPNDLQAVDALGQTYVRLRRPRDAEAMFHRVLAASPNTAVTWNNLGVLYLSESRDQDAVDALSRAIGIDPLLAGAHNTLGVAYARRGERDKAIGEWREALRIRPDFTDARENLDKVLR